MPNGLSFASMGALVVASLVFALVAWQALHLEPLPAVTPSRANEDTSFTLLAQATPRDATTSVVELASDPFSPDRRLRASVEEDLERPDTTPPAAAVAVRLLGTVVRDTTGFAICQLAADVPRVVHLGERLGELTLITLEQGRAVFRAANGTRLELSLAKPGT
jgi:hypothetical protein